MILFRHLFKQLLSGNPKDTLTFRRLFGHFVACWAFRCLGISLFGVVCGLWGTSLCYWVAGHSGGGNGILNIIINISIIITIIIINSIIIK